MEILYFYQVKMIKTIIFEVLFNFVQNTYFFFILVVNVLFPVLTLLSQDKLRVSPQPSTSAPVTC